jgi:hypothetical protein
MPVPRSAHVESPPISPYDDGRAALRMIRETLETLGPVGLLPPETLTPGPRMIDEADVLCDAIKRLLQGGDHHG